MTGDTISISVRPSGENLQYQFYAIDSNGKKEIIRGYTYDAYAKWQPSNAGTYAIYVTAKDTAGNTAEDSWEGIKITKKEEEKPPVKDPEPTTSNSKPTTSNSKPTTAQKPSTYTGVKVNQTATINGITYKVTKVVNAKNAQVTIKSLNKKK